MLSLLLVSFLSSWVTALPATAPCSDSLPKPVLGGATITSFTAAVVHNYAVNITGESNNWTSHNITGLSFCQVNISLTHVGTGDLVNNQVWLPITGWNGIFLGIGGGGYAAGNWQSLAPAVSRGYAAVSTDAGHTQSNSSDATSWALGNAGVNRNLLLDFASKSVHDMTKIGKAITTSFYGSAPKYSYWNGCSTGGRQGSMEAQMYPGDYDGIVAGAPAINWNDFTPAQQWPFTVMNNEGFAPEQCEFTAVTAAAIKACDHLDGLTDGIISAPGLCDFDPETLVGKNYTCNTDGTTRRFSPKIGVVVKKIWQGPVNSKGAPLWYGITPGTNFSSLAPTETFANGTTVPLPFNISDSWFRNYIFKNPEHNTSTITYTEFPALITQSHAQYDTLMGTSNAHLASFKAAGGKMITWQGLADNLIMPNGTMNYFDRVKKLDPNVMDYYRVFFAPGVGHCGGGSGPIPNDVLMNLRAWVENGTAPDVLPASSAYAINGTVRHQNLCPYPLVSKYDGKGDPAKAASFSCAESF
ncbi:hypothetical protein H2200_013525 [Cladophialophora chaetospira]|uniref:Carboxylic ester hydrolase n=1 Tax=Cladophialophora chaetospira TaxID=386627 RepID=A0AA38U7M1_9EURO|nr:hypothetical protein H2200_013525 [Cladophialophora chaetospira]